MRTIPAMTIIIPAFMSLVLITACGPQGREARLSRLEEQRNALNEKIVRLKAEMAGTPSSQPGVSEQLATVRIEQVAPTVFRHFVTVQGTVESDNNILVPPLSPGLVKKIHIEVGERVSAGQLLAELDASVLESSIVELEHSLELAATIYERRQRLWDKKIGSEIEYLQAKNNKEGLEKRLKTLQEQIKLTKITAPISGHIDDIRIREGEMAPAGIGAIRIVELGKLKIIAALAENHISRVKRGDGVMVRIPALNREFDGTIHAVSQVIDPKNRTFQIEIKMPAGEQGLKPNMLAVLTVNDYTNPSAMVVPQNVVQETGTEQFLFVASPQDGRWTARKRIVRTGESYGDHVEIASGLQAGERVITVGFQKIADNQAVSVDSIQP